MDNQSPLHAAPDPGLTGRQGRFPAGMPDGDTVVYGPDIDDESGLRLLGHLEGRRVLELGVGTGRNAVAMARAGAKVIAVDPNPARLAQARQLAERHDVKVEFHQADLADIAFLRADTVDLVVSVHTLDAVVDTDRVFRQVHRVLHTEAPLVLSVTHPAWHLIDADAGEPRRIVRSWFDDTPRTISADDTIYPATFGDLFGGLYRAGFAVDLVLEPRPGAGAPRSPWWKDAMLTVPSTLVLRARKLGL
jgi:SAM-dependent methyltransferase